MSRRIAFALVLLSGLALFALGQTPQSAPRSPASPRDGVTNNVSLALDVRWVTMADNFHERVGPGMEKLPAMGACAVRDAEQTRFLLMAAAGDRRGCVLPPKTISLPNGTQSEFSPYGLDRDIQGKDHIQATLSNDGRSVEIQMDWAKWKNGTDRLPVTTASVPLGSHLLVHTKEVSEGRMARVSLWQQLKDSVLGQRGQRATAWRETQQGYYLISPRVVVASETQTQTAAR
jgi:hypothetical protein